MKILVYQPRASYFVGGGEVYPLQNVKFFARLDLNEIYRDNLGRLLSASMG